MDQGMEVGKYTHMGVYHAVHMYACISVCA